MTHHHPATDSDAPVTRADLARWQAATDEVMARRATGCPDREPESLTDLLRKQATLEGAFKREIKGGTR